MGFFDGNVDLDQGATCFPFTDGFHRFTDKMGCHLIDRMIDITMKIASECRSMRIASFRRFQDKPDALVDIGDIFDHTV
nr:MAG TPA: hypothetical protein [Caudoviricetes sp.]